MPSLTCGGITRLAVERCFLSHLHGTRETCGHSLFFQPKAISETNSIILLQAMRA
jgi:hypothetical protein